jgi:type IV pilus assembly protein PilV
MIRSPRRLRQLAGYALLEALIAVVVASIGFIGAARLQTLGMKMNNSSQLRQKAVLLTYQMTDRVRANRGAAASYTSPTTGYDPSTGDLSCLSTSSGCTPAALAVADMTEWATDIAGQLPGGKGVICVDSTAPSADVAPACNGAGGLTVIQVSWTDLIGTTRFNTVVRP